MTNSSLASEQVRTLNVPADGPELIALRRFRADLGVVPSTAWRWIQRGWLAAPLNIGGRLYLTREQIAEFKRRAAAGEFAVSIKPPHSTRRR